LLAHGRWFSLGTPASSTTKTDLHEKAEILLKGTGTFNTIKPNHPFTDDQIQKILIKCHQNGHHAAIWTFQENILYYYLPLL
jgi:hypothetical protein